MRYATLLLLAVFVSPTAHAQQFKRVEADRAALRAAPNDSAEVKYWLLRDTKVQIERVREDYYKIVKRGWARSPTGWVDKAKMRGDDPSGAQDHSTEHVVRKDPQAATLFGFLIAGGGQIYAGEWQKGTFLLLGATAAPLAGYGMSSGSRCYSAGSPRYTTCEAGNFTPLYVGGVVSAALWLYGLVDAADAARRANQEHGLTVQPTTGGVKLALSF